MIKANKYPPVDVNNNLQMMEEGLRQPYAFRKEDAWLNEVQQPKRKRFFFKQQTKAVQNTIKMYLKSDNAEAISFIRSCYHGLPV